MHSIFFLCICLFYLETHRVEAASDDYRIVGGQDAKNGSVPFEISLRVDDFHVCGGSILNHYWILTAAHCIFKDEISRLTVVAGTNLLNKGGDTYRVEKIIKHPKFSKKHRRDDVGLVKLKSPIKYGEKVRNIKLCNKDISTDTVLQLSGWGGTHYPADNSNKLQTIKLLSISNEECKEYRPVIHATNICTLPKPGHGTCMGDSGDSLVHHGYLVGLVSWGSPCAIGKPDVFTRIKSYIKWINDNINNN